MGQWIVMCVLRSTKHALEGFWLILLLAIDVASANTTMSTMETFVTAMIVHREVQAKSQAEIDRVIGPNRLPTLAEYVYYRSQICAAEI